MDEVRRGASNIAKLPTRCSADCWSWDKVDLDKGLENPSRDQAKQDERTQAQQL